MAEMASLLFGNVRERSTPLARDNIRRMPGVSRAHFPVRGRTSSSPARQIGSARAFSPSMGDVISLAKLRAARADASTGGPPPPAPGPRVTFFFYLLSPGAYL